MTSRATAESIAATLNERASQGEILGYRTVDPVKLKSFTPELCDRIMRFIESGGTHEVMVMCHVIANHSHNQKYIRAVMATWSSFSRIDALWGRERYNGSFSTVNDIYIAYFHVMSGSPLQNPAVDADFNEMIAYRLATKLLPPVKRRALGNDYDPVDIAFFTKNMHLIEPALPLIKACSDTVEWMLAAKVVEAAYYVAAHPVSVDLLATIVNERGYFSVDLLDEVLAADSPVLSDGVL